jgi:undecaprenyl-diphosphatase
MASGPLVEPVPWRGCLLLLIVGLPVLSLLFASDEWLRAQRSLLPGRFWSGLAQSLSLCGNGGFLIPVGLLAALGCHRASHPRAARVLVMIMVSGILAGLAGTSLRSVIGRTRPEVPVEQGWFGPRKEGRWLVGRYAYAAFPSGHASIAAGVGFMAFVGSRRAGAAGVVFSLAVAWSRFHLGAHRASDVWAGWMLGAATAFLLGPMGRRWVEAGLPRPATGRTGGWFRGREE